MYDLSYTPRLNVALYLFIIYKYVIFTNQFAINYFFGRVYEKGFMTRKHKLYLNKITSII